MRRLAAALGLGLAVVVAGPSPPASGHPLGNFTVNTYSGLRVAAEGVTVDFLVDMAEIPTLQHRSGVEAAGPEGYARQSCRSFAERLDLRVDGRALALAVVSSDVAFAPGQAGLSTLRVECAVTAPARTLGDGGEHRVSFASANFTDRAGWREVTAVGDGTTLVESDVPSASVSERLVRYPEGLLSSPLDQRRASLVVRPGGPARAGGATATSAGPARPLPGGLDRATRAFTSFVDRRDLTAGFATIAFGASVLLGALHAFAPGHGKSVMAAYLVGQRGSLRQAMGVALTVTATHTAGVLALGVAISTSTVVAPERVYPWLGAASGVLLALLGLGLLRRILRRPRAGPGHPGHGDDRAGHVHAGHDDGRRAAHDHAGHDDGRPPAHDHGHAHDHDHDPADDYHAGQARDDPGHDHDHGGGHTHSHGWGSHSHRPGRSDPLVTRKGLLAMGFVGGLVPSPSAVVVLLGAAALGRTWFGVFLVVAYGVGMAAALAATGLVLLRARSAIDRRMARLRDRRLLAAAASLLPPATAIFVAAAGVYLTIRAATQF